MRFERIPAEVDMFKKRYIVFGTFAVSLVAVMIVNDIFGFGRFLDWDFLWMIVGIVGCGLLGFVLRSTVGEELDFLFFRRTVRAMLMIAVVGYLLLVFFQPSPEFESLSQEDTRQWLLPQEGTDWFSIIVNILAFYFGSWLLLSGVEKTLLNIGVFFDPSFFNEIKKPIKKKSSVKK